MPNIDEFKQRVLDSLNTALGSDILQLFTDGTVTDVMINPDGKLWVKKLRQGNCVHWHYRCSRRPYARNKHSGYGL